MWNLYLVTSTGSSSSSIYFKRAKINKADFYKDPPRMYANLEKVT